MSLKNAFRVLGFILFLIGVVNISVILFKDNGVSYREGVTLIILMAIVGFVLAKFTLSANDWVLLTIKIGISFALGSIIDALIFGFMLKTPPQPYGEFLVREADLISMFPLITVGVTLMFVFINKKG